ncbi:hypothetical protein Q9290_05925 [Oceanimonas sp. CHS3-5]|uniref:hypothetical protein n=1 Tax=Oceanimonas sp. CHS3-5 TaxID=3068186 RepID=UPI00273EC104|nr:hypothetical protein [Oceanimonas sp. CHS3-5]MDP5291827.1 hypothetical protein [Oceanimonas sp. CHS3-5]
MMVNLYENKQEPGSYNYQHYELQSDELSKDNENMPLKSAFNEAVTTEKISIINEQLRELSDKASQTKAALYKLKNSATEPEIKVAHSLLSEIENKINNLNSRYNNLSLIENQVLSLKDDLDAKDRALKRQLDGIDKTKSEIEEEYKNEIKRKEAEFRFKEERLANRQKTIEKELKKQLEENENIRDRIQNELIEKNEELQKILIETKEEKEKYEQESIKALETKSKKFIASTLGILGNNEKGLKTKASYWSFAGVAAISAGIIFAIYSMFFNADSFHNTSNNSLSYYFYTLFRGIISIGLFLILARYCFRLCDSFMHESLKVSERIHAIKYGEFYLDVSGPKAEWDNIKEAFSNWNIDGRSAFYEVKGNENEKINIEKETSEILLSKIIEIFKREALPENKK